MAHEERRERPAAHTAAWWRRKWDQEGRIQNICQKAKTPSNCPREANQASTLAILRAPEPVQSTTRCGGCPNKPGLMACSAQNWQYLLRSPWGSRLAGLLGITSSPSDATALPQRGHLSLHSWAEPLMGGRYLRVLSADLTPFVMCSSLALAESPERRRRRKSE